LASRSRLHAQPAGCALIPVALLQAKLRASLAVIAIGLGCILFDSSPAEAAPARSPGVNAPTAQVVKPRGQTGAHTRPAAPTRARPASVAERQQSVAHRPTRAEADQSILAMLHHAARRHGVEPSLLIAMAWRESRFDPLAVNPQSSARGLMQFTEATWLETVRDYGAAHGLAQEAAVLRTDPRTGTISAPDTRELRHLLTMRFDPQLSAALAAARMAAARTTLEAGLARAVTASDLYAVHLLGMGGARRFLAAHGGQRAADVVGPQVAGRNRGVFFDRDGRALDVAEVRDAITRSTAVSPVVLTSPVPARMELASATHASGW
jgi:hypothetical protein